MHQFKATLWPKVASESTYEAQKFQNFLGEPPDHPSPFCTRTASGLKPGGAWVCPRCALALPVFWLRHCTVQNSLDNTDTSMPLTQDCPPLLIESTSRHYKCTASGYPFLPAYMYSMGELQNAPPKHSKFKSLKILVPSVFRHLQAGFFTSKTLDYNWLFIKLCTCLVER